MSITALHRCLAGCLLAAILATAAPAFADCLADGNGTNICGPGPCAVDDKGNVYCAPHQDGTVVRKDSGEVVCAWAAVPSTLTAAISARATPVVRCPPAVISPVSAAAR